MKTKKLAFWATTALMGNAFVAAAASAQSTGTRAAENPDVVVITADSGVPTAGAAVAQTVDKTRSTVDQDTISRENPGQTILQTLNLAPGLNFTNSDPYGNSGGNIRLRGFDGNRVGLAFDGVPLNDTGNYATFTNQLLDPELITQASVNQGTTDADSPTAAAIGGIINYVSAIPDSMMGLQADASVGEFNYNRIYLRGDTGEIGPWGTKAYATASHTRYTKFKGSGNLDKWQFNGKVYQPIGEGNDFVAVAFHYNRNRNAFYNNFTTLAILNAGGPYPENDLACALPLGVSGTVQNEGTQSSIIDYLGHPATGSCTNYTGLRINPSDTGNVRINSRFQLAENLTLTIDPSFQYVMANGGGFTTISERDDRLDQNGTNNATLTTGASCSANATVFQTGVDLNGDGDTCDQASIYTPSNTNTRRYGVLGSLIWKVEHGQQLRVSYTNDYGRHRQTGEAIDFGRIPDPAEVFGGKESWGEESLRVFGRDGSFYRSRDRFSLAILNQFSVDYVGKFLDDALTFSVGVRDPMFKRELNQYCYTQNGTSTVLCTTVPIAATLANGNVQLVGQGTTQFVAPYKTDVKYDKVLPNVSVGYDFGESKVYASYSEQIAAPRTDNLYTAFRNATATSVQPIAFNSVQPEFAKNSEIGYRFTNHSVVGSVSIYQNTYSNRVVTTLDNDPTSPTFNTTIDRNVGKVKTDGAEGSLGWNVTDTLSLYGSFTYTDAKLQEDQLIGTFTCPATPPTTGNGAGCTANQIYPLILPTKGKHVVETPEWMYTARAGWDVTPELSLGLQAKFVDKRFTTDVNDEVLPSYTTVDFDARYDLTHLVGAKDLYIQFNVTNLTNEVYGINVSSGNNALTIADVNPDPAVVNNRTGLARTFGIGAERTAVVTLGSKF